MASAKASLKGERISGQEAKKAGEEWAAKAGSKIDSTVEHPLPFSFCITKDFPAFSDQLRSQRVA